MEDHIRAAPAGDLAAAREYRRGRASRARAPAIGAVARVHSPLAQALHRYFDEQGFLLVSTLITASDTEGAGEMFTSQRWIWKTCRVMTGAE